MKKKRKKLGKIVAGVLVAAVIVLIVFGRKNNSMGQYEEETVQIRDIITYNKFSGNVVASDSKNIISEASAKVLSVLVDEGDEVKKGDVIATLDASNLEFTISLKEAALNLSDLSTVYNKRDAQKAYDDFKNSLDNGENAQLLSAQASLTNAKTGLDSAKTNLANATKNYNDALEGKLDGSSLAALHESAIRANAAVASAEEAYNANEAQIERIQAESLTATGGDASELAVYLAKRAELSAALSSARTAAGSVYNQYVSSSDSLDDSIDQLKTVMENAQTAVENAENSYRMAQDSYSAALTAVNQTLQTYQNAVEKTNALSSNETSVLELENLYEQLEDYTITAPMDGVVTTISLKEGAMATTGMMVAQVTDFDVMEIEIKIDEYDILGMKVGTEVEVSVDALEVTFEGKITEISRFATVAGGVSYFTAKVEFNPDDNVRSGMSVEVKTVSRSAPQSVSVSVDAIRTKRDNTAYVLVRGEKNEEVEVPVSVGVSDGKYVQITEGLKEGDVVLVTPTNAFLEMMMQ